MFCENCGTEISDDAVVCPNCGVATGKPHVAAHKENTIAIVGLVLAFFIPLVGLICSIIGLKKSGECGGDGKGFAIGGIVVSCGWFILAIIFYAVIFGFAFAIGG